MSMNQVLVDIATERQRQLEKWGDQTHPFTAIGAPAHKYLADQWKRRNDKMNDVNPDGIAWDSIALEELHEAFAEEDPAKIRQEAIETAAVMVALVEQIDRQAVPQDPT